jgi:hypothetical protein
MERHWRKIGLTVGWLAFAALCIWAALQLDARQTRAEGDIEKLFRAQRSGDLVESQGVVAKVFSDDLRGSRHQRLLVRLASGHTVLISHNIDLAARVENVGPGDPIVFRGEYAWNDKGGVVHWTHHDPDGRHPGGWLRHDGRTYR